MYTPPPRLPLFTEHSANLPLRHYFAGQAMPLAVQMLRDDLGNARDLQTSDFDLLADLSYQIADAMLTKGQNHD